MNLENTANKIKHILNSETMNNMIHDDFQHIGYCFVCPCRIIIILVCWWHTYNIYNKDIYNSKDNQSESCLRTWGSGWQGSSNSETSLGVEPWGALNVIGEILKSQIVVFNMIEQPVFQMKGDCGILYPCFWQHVLHL